MIPNQNMGRNKIITTPYLLILEPRGETCKRIVCFRKKAQPTSKQRDMTPKTATLIEAKVETN